MFDRLRVKTQIEQLASGHHAVLLCRERPDRLHPGVGHLGGYRYLKAPHLRIRPLFSRGIWPAPSPAGFGRYRRKLGSRRFSVSPETWAITSTWPSSGVPRSFVASRSSTWKMPAELFISISTLTARSSPCSIETLSIAAAERA